MKKRFWPIKTVVTVALIAMAILVAMLWLLNIIAGAVGTALLIGVLIFTVVRLRRLRKNMLRIMEDLSLLLRGGDHHTLAGFPLPLICINQSEEILWYNELFRSLLPDREDPYGRPCGEILPQLELQELSDRKQVELSIGDRLFTGFLFSSPEDGSGNYLISLVDNTEFKQIAAEYRMSRPVVALIAIDNYEDLIQSIKESEKGQLISGVQDCLERYFSATRGTLLPLERDRYLAVFEERDLQRMIEDRFSLLEMVKQSVPEGKMPPTLSIGIGQGAGSVREGEVTAMQALEMALGRGGDQAAVKSGQEFRFFGGISMGVEKRTKVKTRIVASALRELIETSDSVVIMGHRLADLDCVGAACGMLRAARHFGKPAVIAIDKTANLSQPLLSLFSANGCGDSFVDISLAREALSRKTLLIIVDTHNPAILESRELYEACQRVVVIDHHRKIVGHIENATLFFHEPFASSACEMVAELLQYMGENIPVSKLESEALLAGIMLDTKNLTLRTGVRTFEAAAFLRRCGADPVAVKRLFSAPMEVYRKKTELVALAEVYRGCAIAVNEYFDEDIRLVAPQTADELLGITGVTASFVIYPQGTGSAFSARSMGDMNVQVIMEQLGGGGHLTMAGAQLKDIPPQEARQMLITVIDKYCENEL